MCATTRPIMSRDLVVDPKTKGVAYGFAFLVKPKGDSTAQVKALLDKSPQGRARSEGLRVPALRSRRSTRTRSWSSSRATPSATMSDSRGFNNTGVNTMVAPNGQFAVNRNLVAESRPMELHCDIHTWMTGYLLVLDHPFFTTTAADGSFEIKDVPAGSQNLIVWQQGRLCQPGLWHGECRSRSRPARRPTSARSRSTPPESK